jgi:hypothetical protein
VADSPATCEVVTPHGELCGEPAIRRVGYNSTGCLYPDEPTAVAYCADHWPVWEPESTTGTALGCGCVPLETIDLTRADPGAEYADLLRQL